MKKAIVVLLSLCLLLACLPGFAAQEQAPFRVGALKGPTAMGLVKLMADQEGKTDYDFTLAASPDALLPALTRGELDAACVPVNLAAILYKNTKGALQVSNINTLGVLYIVERGDTVKTIKDLSGRKVYASGKASTPEYVLTHLLNKAGVADADIQWKAEHSEALAALMADPEALAMLPQPFVSVAQGKAPDLNIAVDLNQAWQELTGQSLITGVTVIRKEVIENQPERVEKFLSDYAASMEWVQANHHEAALLIEKQEILAAGPAEKALPYCGLAFVRGEDMHKELTAFYQVLFDQNPASVGGTLPDDAFYFLQ